MSIANLADSVRYPSRGCIKVNTGKYIVGNGMDAGMTVYCYWKLIKGKVHRRRLRSVNVEGSNHDRTVSRLGTFMLCPETDTAIVEINNRYGKHRVRLVKIQAKSQARKS